MNPSFNHWDHKTQFYYLQERYYNPRLGRFLSMDPWCGDIETPTLNRYVYAYNNPVNFVDPTGNLAWYQLDDLGAGLGKSALNSAIDILLAPKYLWEMSKAMVQGKLSFSQLIKAMKQGTIGPIQYLVKNHNLIWRDKPRDPKDKEVTKYGENLGDTLQLVTGSGAAIKVFTKALPKLGAKLGKLAKEAKNSKSKPKNINAKELKSSLYREASTGENGNLEHHVYQQGHRAQDRLLRVRVML